VWATDTWACLPLRGMGQGWRHFSSVLHDREREDGGEQRVDVIGLTALVQWQSRGSATGLPGLGSLVMSCPCARCGVVDGAHGLAPRP
jgi:hypothetical protein